MLRRESDKNEALVNYLDITFGKLLGSGGFGEVYHGTWRHNDVAVKKLLLKDITPESAAEFETESQIMARLRSPNIVQFYGYAIEPERCIVMEYCPNGSLRDVLRSQQPLEWTVRIKIALGAAKGLAFLHEEKILHRDIKSLNILLTEHFEAKLTDFGLSKLKTESKSESSVHNKSGKERVGTVQWVAPELFNRRGVFTQKSDIYSLGITFWELASRQIPFASAPSLEVIPMWVKEGEREDIPADCPPTFGTLIQQCWKGDPSARPDTNAIITQLKNSVEAFSAPKISNAPSPNPSPFPASSGPQYLSNLVSEDVPKPLVFSPSQPKQPVHINTPRPQPAIQIKQTSPQAIAAFVRLVAEGEQDQAEALLQKDTALALLPSDVTDLSARTFKGITGFQYAVWALDWHMWTMILKYLPKDQAIEQIKAMDKGPWISQHRKSGDWLIQNLVDALQTQINLFSQKKLSEADTQWQMKVGGAQRLLPVHVINEYCHPTRQFKPYPDFTKSDPLPRTRKTDKGEWFTSSYNGGMLGEKFAIVRYASAMVTPRVFGGDGGRTRVGFDKPPCTDHKACQTLLVTRVQQRDALIAELLNAPQNTNNVPNPKPSPYPAPPGAQYLSNLVSEEAPKPLVFSPSKSHAHINRARPAGPQIQKGSHKDLLLNTLSGHTSTVLCLQPLPSGELVSGSDDSTLKLWDLRTGTCLKTLKEHSGSVSCLQLLPSGELVSDSGYTLKLWDLRTGKCIKSLIGHSGSVSCLQLLPSGKLVSASWDNTLKVWNLIRGTCRKTLEGHSGSVSCLQLLPSGELVSGSWDNTIKVWDLRTGNCLKTLTGHHGSVYCLQLLPSGELVSGSRDTTLKVWDLRTGTCLKTLTGHAKAVSCLQLLPSGELVSGSYDKTLKVWDLRTGTCLKTLAGHADFVRCLQPLPSGELVSSSDDSTLKVWDLRTGTCLKTLAGHVRLVSCLQLLPSGELVSGSGDKTLKVWDLTEFSLAPVIEEKKAYRPMK